tara:strand:+ start:379 stop:867 length:489 start_codon:yes stop_codon:yes gene_type:complete
MIVLFTSSLSQGIGAPGMERPPRPDWLSVLLTPIFYRWAAAFVLMAATFNPTQWNYVRWASRSMSDQLPMVVLVGLVLVIGYTIYLRATLRSIGAVGMGLVSAVVAALVWVLIDAGWMRLSDPSATTWLVLVALSAVLGIGLSWSIIRRRLSGQADVDDVDL